MADSIITVNGVNGSTGDYGLPPIPLAKMAEFITGQAAPEDLANLKSWYNQHKTNQFSFSDDPKKLAEIDLKKEQFGLFAGDTKDLAQTGWGVIFAQDDHKYIPALKAALKPLLDLRRSQAGDRFCIFEGADACRSGESKMKFLARHGKGPIPPQPGEKIPYYLMIVGSPEKITYQFQSQLDFLYAVGRLYFERADGSPNLAAYANYAHSVVAAETGQVKLPRQAVFFGTTHADDPATQLSSTHLIQPLYQLFKNKEAFSYEESYKPNHEEMFWLNDWQYHLFAHEQATKANLKLLLGGAQTPALLFTATHGMEFSQDDPRQLPHQGALMCAEWPGPKKHKGKILQDYYFAGDDINREAQLLGSVVLCFASYGAGTPLYDNFARQAFNKRESVASRSFVAQLPSRLLSHPNGGALAVVGYVERAWPYSFLWDGQGKNYKVIQQPERFENLLERLFKNYPIGSAVEQFNYPYGEFATELTYMLDEIEVGAQFSPHDVVGLWTAHNNVRDYIVLGDPAIRLAVAESSPIMTRFKGNMAVIVSAPPPAETKADISKINESFAEKLVTSSINNTNSSKKISTIENQRLEQLQKLIDLLLACDTMKSRDSRDVVVNDLPSEINSNIKRMDAAKMDIRNIINTCLKYPKGFEKLFEVIRFYEGPSFSMEHLDNFLLSLGDLYFS